MNMQNALCGTFWLSFQILGGHKMTFPSLDFSRLLVCPLYALEVSHNIEKVNVAICSHIFLDWLAYKANISRAIIPAKFVKHEFHSKSRLVVQHSCPVSVKSKQQCRRSWEDKPKCEKNLSIKSHNSCKTRGTWIISLYASLDLWCNAHAKFQSNPCNNVGEVEKTS